MCFIGCDMYVYVYVILKVLVVLMLGFIDFVFGDKIYSIYVYFEVYIDLCSMFIVLIVDDDNVWGVKCIVCMCCYSLLFYIYFNIVDIIYDFFKWNEMVLLMILY